MTGIVLLISINLILMAFAIFNTRRKNLSVHESVINKHFGMLELAWSVFSILLALYVTFGVFAEANVNTSFFKVAGGSQITLLIILYVFGILHFLRSSIILIKLIRNSYH